MKGSTNKYAELVEIKDVPDMGAEGGTIEVTTLKSAIKQYIPDRPDTPAQDYTYNRTNGNYEKVKAICDGKTHEFLTIASDGSSTYTKGVPQTWKKGYGTGSAQEAILHIVATEISDKTVEETTALLATE